jgi:hypothetical protein
MTSWWGSFVCWWQGEAGDVWKVIRAGCPLDRERRKPSIYQVPDETWFAVLRKDAGMRRGLVS